MIYLLRHGEIEGAEVKRFIGQTDVPLNETGIKQAYFWKKELGHIKFSKVYSSDLSRTVETAKIVSGLSEERLLKTKVLFIALGLAGQNMLN